MNIYQRIEELPANGELWAVSIDGITSYRTYIVLPKEKALQLLNLIGEGLIAEIDYKENFEKVEIAKSIQIRLVQSEDLATFVAKKLLVEEENKQ